MKKQTIIEMLKENTGIHMLDSGGDDGRHWQHNQDRDFESEPEITYDTDNAQDSSELYPTINIYRHMMTAYDMDGICEEFNRLDCKEWDADYYGISKEQQTWLSDRGFEFGDSYNTYNYDNNLGQDLQGTKLTLGEIEYELVQVHGGCDARGGYTDAKLFKVDDINGYIQDIFGTIDGVEVSTAYNGRYLLDVDGKPVKITAKSKIDLHLN